MNTFVLVAVTFVAIIVHAAEDRGPRDSVFTAFIEDCQKSTKASDSEVKAFLSRQPVTTKAGWCMVACIKKKAGAINEKNQLDMDKLKENMAGMKASNKELFEKVMALMSECKKEVEADPKNTADECVFAEAIGKCIFSKKAAAGIP